MPKSKTYTTKDGFTGNVSQIAKHYAINGSTLRSLLSKGMTIDEAIEYCITHKRTVKVYKTKDGFTGTIKKVAEYYDIKELSLRRHLQKEIDIDEAIKYCIEHKRKIYTTSDGFEGTIAQISEHYNINRETLTCRINAGMTIDEAINYKRSIIYTTSDGFSGTVP